MGFSREDSGGNPVLENGISSTLLQLNKTDTAEA